MVKRRQPSTKHGRQKTGSHTKSRTGTRGSGLNRVATGAHGRVAEGAAGPSMDRALGLRYAVLIVALVMLVVVAGSLLIADSVSKSAEKLVVEACIAQAQNIGVLARQTVENNRNTFKLSGAGGLSETYKNFKVISIVVRDSDNRFMASIGAHSRGIQAPYRTIVSRKNLKVVKGFSRKKLAIQAKVDIYSSKLARNVAKVLVLADASGIAAMQSNAWIMLLPVGVIAITIGILVSLLFSSTAGEMLGEKNVQMRRMNKQLGKAKEKEKVVERIEHDLEAAREIQAQLLPPKIPQIPGFDIQPFYRSAKEVGGDYYDFFPVDQEHLALVVADVSGKGIPGSMVMAQTRTLLHLLGPQHKDAPDIMKHTNFYVARDIRRGMFVTAVLALLNVKTKELLVCSAGHNPTVLFREAKNDIELINPGGIALGFDKGPIFDRTLQEYKIQLDVGDRLVMYTDGVVEAMNEAQDEYGDDRFYDFVRQNARMRSKDFVSALVHDLDDHKGDAEQHDDITISTFRVTE